MRNRLKKLTYCALLAATATIVFVIEAQIPPLTAIPGIKLGLSNVFSLVAIFLFDPLSGVCISIVRILLGGFLTGQVSAMMYSFAGAIPSIIFCILIYKKFVNKHFWPISCIAAVIHNTGQLALAILVTGTKELAAYYPLLIISGIVTGAFTGICSELAEKRLKKLNLL